MQNTASPLQALRAAIDRLHPLAADAWESVQATFTERAVAAGEHLLSAGGRAVRVYFVTRGLLREYYVDAGGREFTRQFLTPGDFSGSLADLLSDEAATVSIQALSAATVLQADWRRLDALAEADPALMKLLRRVAEALYVRKSRREWEMLTLPAAERYRRYRQQFPELDNRLHRYQVASYLGITPVHLGRLRPTTKT